MPELHIKERIEAAYQLLTKDSISREAFEEVRTLLKDIHPRIDKTLNFVSDTLSNYEKMHKGEIVEFTLEKLPEETEEQKKRKKLLLFFLKRWKELRSEVERVQKELSDQENNRTNEKKLEHGAKIASGAKGPLGIITIAAVVIVIAGGVMLYRGKDQTKPTPQSQTTTISPSPKPTVKVILFRGKQIPLTELAERNGPDCDSPHYHALNHISVKALDGTIIQDPGACAFGKVKEAAIVDSAL